MSFLGQQGKVAVVKETEHEWELIIPHNLLPKLSFVETPVARFRKHPALPITSRWCLEGEAWQPWNEEPEGIPDVDTSWLSSPGEALK